MPDIEQIEEFDGIPDIFINDEPYVVNSSGNFVRVKLTGTVKQGKEQITNIPSINVPLQQQIGGLQTLGGSGLVGGPPMSPGLLSPEIVPEPATDEELLNATTASTEAYNRIKSRLPGYNPDALIQGKGWKTLDEMKTHSAYDSPLRLKKYAIGHKEWDTLPRVNGRVVGDDHPRYDRANEIADFCRFALSNIYNEETGQRQDFREVVWYFLDACHSGNSTQEVQWRIVKDGKYKGKRVFARFIPRVPQQITYNLNPLTNEVVSINNYTNLGWQSYLPVFRKFFRYTYQPEGGLPWGHGDARACYKHVFALNEITRMWGVALQKHGGGFLKGVTQNPNPDHIAAFVAQLDQAAGGNSVVITADKSVDILNLPGGALDAFRHPMEYHEMAITKEILGQVLTTGQGVGSSSYALGDVHHATEEYFKAFPRRDMEDQTRNQLYYWLIYTNFGEEDLDCLPDHSQGIWNWEEQQMIAKFMETMTGIGFVKPSLDDEWARKLCGMPLLPTTAELTDNPAILPDKERVIISVGGEQYKGSLIKPEAQSTS